MSVNRAGMYEFDLVRLLDGGQADYCHLQSYLGYGNQQLISSTWPLHFSSLVFSLLVSGAPHAPHPARISPALKLPDTTITLAAITPAGTLTPPYGAALENLPPFCRVAGRIAPTSDSDIYFEVWLPASGWNGKFLGVGNGGFAGAVGYSSLAE